LLTERPRRVGGLPDGPPLFQFNQFAASSMALSNARSLTSAPPPNQTLSKRWSACSGQQLGGDGANGQKQARLLAALAA